MKSRIYLLVLTLTLGPAFYAAAGISVSKSVVPDTATLGDTVQYCITLNSSTGQQAAELVQTKVYMRPYSDEEISGYVASGDPLDKAGAYAIQHQEFNPVAYIQGCYASVMGLPLCHLTRALNRLGLTPSVDVPHVCQDSTGHRCSIAAEILDALMCS